MMVAEGTILQGYKDLWRNGKFLIYPSDVFHKLIRYISGNEITFPMVMRFIMLMIGTIVSRLSP
jgi:hypothetical protein